MKKDFPKLGMTSDRLPIRHFHFYSKKQDMGCQTLEMSRSYERRFKTRPRLNHLSSRAPTCPHFPLMFQFKACDTGFVVVGWRVVVVGVVKTTDTVAPQSVVNLTRNGQ